MKIVKITSKYQTTIPQEIRKQLNLKIGDSVVFAVVVKKVESLDKIYLNSLSKTLTEWDSELDEKAYNDL